MAAGRRSHMPRPSRRVQARRRGRVLQAWKAVRKGRLELRDIDADIRAEVQRHLGRGTVPDTETKPVRDPNRFGGRKPC